MESPIPLPVERAIHKLGSDISLARRRRHISQASLAERMGASLSTVRRMEKGDVRVPIHFFARALHVFGEIAALEHLLGRPVLRRSLPGRAFDPPVNVLDIRRARTELHWQPAVAFDDGVASALQWLRSVP